MDERVPIAAGDQAAFGITPPGNTQTPFCASVNVLQFGAAYGSPGLTVYPNRLESTWAQVLEGATVAGHGLVSLGINASTHPVSIVVSKIPRRLAPLGNNKPPLSAPCTFLLSSYSF